MMGEPEHGAMEKFQKGFQERLGSELLKRFSNTGLNIALDIDAELGRAKMHGEAFVSAHEAHSVIQEEFEEFWEHVKKKRKDRCGEEMRKELIQLAAMAVKAIQSLPNFVGGKV